MRNTEQTKQVLGALRSALLEQWPEASSADLEPLQSKGLAHDHVRILGTGYLARIPKQSQMRLAATENFRYQKACFDRASQGGFAPHCERWIKPTKELARGALIVQEIVGRHALLPKDLTLIAESFAALHGLELPNAEQCPPLLNEVDPLQAMWEEVDQQSTYLAQAELAPSVERAIRAELARFSELCSGKARPVKRLIVFDGHPGNFVIASDNGTEKAYLVDLEKCRYSYPSFDLAHATLYTSTTWDIHARAELSLDHVATAYRAWASNVDADLARQSKDWHLPLRRAMWLWSITWCAKWRVSSRLSAAKDSSGEDWSIENVDAALSSHVRERVDHYLSEEGLCRVLEEFASLQKTPEMLG